MSETVWIVESGEYSGRGIAGVFSTEAAAEACAATFRGRASWQVARVMAYPLNATFDAGRVWWDVTLFEESGEAQGERLDGAPERDAEPWERDAAGLREAGWAPRRQWSVWVQAPDEASAVKVAAERVAQYRAEQEGIA